jgi:putative membrane protein
MAHSRFAFVRVASAALVLSLPACKYLRPSDPASSPAAPATAETAPERSPRSMSLNDRDVTAIFLAANNTDVSYAQVALAPGRTTNADVLAFANRMLSDHGGLNRSMMDLLSTTNIVPRDNTMSLDFRDESAAKRDTLRERTGPAFDSTYMANEVLYHTRFLATLDSLLIPSTGNSDLRALLTRTRPAVAAHLEHATRVQAGLGK